MTEFNNSGAPNTSLSDTNWNQLNWPSIEQNVYRLQMRIAKAVCKKQFGRVKALQWLLVNSVHTKLLAVKRVTTAKGSRTPGIDGEVWTNTDEKYQAALNLKARGYQAKPLRRIYIPKKNGKMRPFEHTHHEGQGYASTLLASIRANRRNDWGFKFIRI